MLSFEKELNQKTTITNATLTPQSTFNVSRKTFSDGGSLKYSKRFWDDGMWKNESFSQIPCQRIFRPAVCLQNILNILYIKKRVKNPLPGLMIKNADTDPRIKNVKTSCKLRLIENLIVFGNY